MSTISSVVDREALTLRFTTEFDAPVERIWQVWEDPRQLERWWGPPTWPATFVDHSLVAGSRSNYYMTGPDGDKAPGWWIIDVVDPPERFEFRDGFSDESGQPDESMPTTHAVVTLEALEDGRTRMTTMTSFESLAQLEQLVAMGMVEGMTLAQGQIDGILAG